MIRASRAALITGFVTGNLFIVLPMLIENAKQLFAERNMATDDTDNYAEVLVPASRPDSPDTGHPHSPTAERNNLAVTRRTSMVEGCTYAPVSRQASGSLFRSRLVKCAR